MAKKKTAKPKLSKPTSVTLRSFQVGFGDCFLLTFNYGDGNDDARRHVLIDFGSTAQPKRGAVPMAKIADEIKAICKGKLHAVVATHRHRDHISGFGGKPGKTIASLNPDVVVQPWTEHPNAAVRAKEAPEVRVRAKGFVGALAAMHTIAESSLKEIQTLRASATVKNQLRFLGDDNLANRAAIDTLMGMKCTHTYVNHGSKSGLEEVLPGVTIRVLGPPNLRQSRAIEVQRSEDPEEFWHLQAAASRRVTSPGGGALFPRARKVTGSILPLETRWFLPRVEAIRGEQLLEIVRILDKQMNNTSVILLFEVGGKKLLFPGDAQLENWMFALKEAGNAKATRKLLSKVDVYKVGHHGSLNATPKSLWKLFARKGASKKRNRLTTVMSTMANKHGSVDRDTEVPRSKLVTALTDESHLVNTQSLTSKTKFFNEVHIPV
jgi:L-ascorbate metabolism protein UlaG (beta-lactamase superfamily)